MGLSSGRKEFSIYKPNVEQPDPPIIVGAQSIMLKPST